MGEGGRADFSLRCGSKLLFQVDMGFFGIKRSHSLPRSQALCSSENIGKDDLMWCGIHVTTSDVEGLYVWTSSYSSEICKESF